MTHRLTTVLSVRIAQRVAQYIDQLADREGTTPSSIVRRLLAERIEEASHGRR